MGKTGKWIKHFLTGKKDKERVGRAGDEIPATPVSAGHPREKKRWSFRRSSATAPPPAAGERQHRDLVGAAAETSIRTALPPNRKEEFPEPDPSKKMQELAAAAATVVAAAKAAVAVIQLTSGGGGGGGRAHPAEEAAAIVIQSVFRGYLARKALNALKGLVKLQALIRGHLVRKQAAATLRCMEALITAQARARAQRLRMAGDQETGHHNNRRLLLSLHGKSSHDNKSRHPSYQDHEREEGRRVDEAIMRIMEMDLMGDGSRKKQEAQHMSPAPSAMTDQSPRVFSSHFEDYSYSTPQSSPHCQSKPTTPIPYAADSLYHEYPFYPSYMANTESSRAKARSHSAPKQRPTDTFDRQPSRRRPSIEGRNLPRAVRMQRSASQVGSAAQNNYPWSIKLDRSNVSVKDSECGSTCSVLTTNTMYSRHVVGFEVQGYRY